MKKSGSLKIKHVLTRHSARSRRISSNLTYNYIGRFCKACRMTKTIFPSMCVSEMRVLCVRNRTFVARKTTFVARNRTFMARKQTFVAKKQTFVGRKVDFCGSKTKLFFRQNGYKKRQKKGCPFFENKHHLSIERERERKKKFVLLNC
jgi:hypothetical protein